MSQRTIVEFNHDRWTEISKNPNDFFDAILEMLRGGSEARGVRSALRHYGVTVTPTHHHSDVARLTMTTEHGHTFFDEEI